MDKNCFKDKKCSHCNSINPFGAHYCGNCGKCLEDECYTVVSYRQLTSLQTDNERLRAENQWLRLWPHQRLKRWWVRVSADKWWSIWVEVAVIVVYYCASFLATLGVIYLIFG